MVKVVHTLFECQKFKPWKLSKVHLFFFDFHWLTSDLDADASLASSSCTLFDLTNFLFVLIKVFHIKGSFKSEDTGEFLLLQNKYSKLLSWAENFNKMFTVLGRKFKCSAQDSNLEYLSWRSKNLPVSSDLKPPLVPTS